MNGMPTQAQRARGPQSHALLSSPEKKKTQIAQAGIRTQDLQPVAKPGHQGMDLTECANIVIIPLPSRRLLAAVVF